MLSFFWRPFFDGVLGGCCPKKDLNRFKLLPPFGILVTMKTITKADVPRIRAIIAQKFPVERSVSKKWSEVNAAMGSVSASETVRGLKIVLALVETAEKILVAEVASRGQEGTLRAMDRLDEIKKEAGELLEMLEN